MRSWIGKTSLNADDIEALVGLPETPLLEFKRDLSVKKGGDSPWKQGEKRIDDKSRNALLDEIVAFANSEGGWLVLGVVENDEKPGRAIEINPLPNISDLAERIQKFVDDLVDPMLPEVGIYTVPINEVGGVLVVRIPRSELRPHRNSANRKVCIRRQTSVSEATMRETTDLALRQHKHIIEGVWITAFQTSQNNTQSAVVTLINGKIYGGDSQYYYLGHYDLFGDNILADLTANHYFGSKYTAWGDYGEKVFITVKGRVENDTVNASMIRPDSGATLPLTLTRIETLN